jgi:hypothetical protein
LLKQFGIDLIRKGDFLNAYPLIEKSIALNKSVFGEKHLETARSLTDMGDLWLSMGAP